MKAASALLILSVLLVGCTPGPKPGLPPEIALAAPPAWRNAQVTAAATAATPDNWWTAFGSTTLTALVQSALEHNDDVAIALARVEAARADETFARAQLNPSLDLEPAALRDRDVSPFGQPRQQTTFYPQLVIAYDADLFGRLRSGDAAARSTYLASQAARDATRLAVAAATSSGYITLCALQTRLGIAQNTLQDRAAALKLARRRADAGYISSLDLAQAQAEYHATEALIPQISLAIARQQNGLNVLLGRPPSPLDTPDPINRLTAPPAPGDLPAAILRQRPDLAQAENLVVAADHRLDAARAAFLPDIRLSAAAGDVISTLLADPIAVWSVSGSALAPIYEGGRLRAQNDAAIARRTEAAFTYRRVAINAFREVEDGLAAVAATQLQLDALVQQRSALARALTLATKRYTAGYAPYLDQLDAQRSLLNVELAIVQVQNDRLLASVSLFQATGGGWRAAL